MGIGHGLLQVINPEGKRLCLHGTAPSNRPIVHFYRRHMTEYGTAVK